MRYLLVLSIGIAMAVVASMGSVRAQGGPDVMMTLGRCAPGSTPAGVARFQNVGKNDINEGAPNFVAIRLCVFRPDVAIGLTVGRCQGRTLNQVRFKNVGDNDFNEGAPNYVSVSLCIRGPVHRFYALTRAACPPGLRPVGAVRFQNVANNDFNEGAPNFITIRLCVEVG